MKRDASEMDKPIEFFHTHTSDKAICIFCGQDIRWGEPYHVFANTKATAHATCNKPKEV